MVAKHRDVVRNSWAFEMHGTWVRGIRRQQEDGAPLSTAPLSKALTILLDNIFPHFSEEGGTEPTRLLRGNTCLDRQ